MPPAGRSRALPGGHSRGPFVRVRDGGPLRAIVGFVVRFLAIWAGILFAVSRFPRISEWAVAGTVECIRLALCLVGFEPEVEGVAIDVGQVSVEIINDCTSIAPTVGLWAAILAFPAPTTWKLAGLAAGALALWLYNVARILLIMPILAFDQHLFPAIHAYFWQTLTLAVVCILFAAWHRLQPPARDTA